jgi:hypothetical protein
LRKKDRKILELFPLFLQSRYLRLSRLEFSIHS